jgi:hypothetical protein
LFASFRLIGKEVGPLVHVFARPRNVRREKSHRKREIKISCRFVEYIRRNGIQLRRNSNVNIYKCCSFPPRLTLNIFFSTLSYVFIFFGHSQCFISEKQNWFFNETELRSLKNVSEIPFVILNRYAT